MMREKRKKLPHFKSDEEFAEFFETHSTADYWHEFKPVKEKFELSPRLKKQIQERRIKRMVTLRLEENQIEAAKYLSTLKSIPYQTLLRMWIREGINREISPRLNEYKTSSQQLGNLLKNSPKK